MRIVVYQIPEKEEVVYNLGHLLEKLCTRKIGILCDKNNINELDKGLWTFSTNAFVPHEIATIEDNDAVDTINNINSDNDMQPVLLSDDINAICRDIVCVLKEDDLKLALNFNYANSKKMGRINDVIYMTKENINIDSLKEMIESKNTATNDENSPNNNVLVIYKKDNGKWKEL